MQSNVSKNEFVRYEEVPENISKKIIEERNKDK